MSSRLMYGLNTNLCELLICGCVCVGNYLNDKMHGMGTYFFSDGTRYDGEWENDMSHGKGSFLYSDGAKYIGAFSRDQKHGPGVMYLPSGEIFSESWMGG